MLDGSWRKKKTPTGKFNIAMCIVDQVHGAPIFNSPANMPP
jgi:hypothetical protein